MRFVKFNHHLIFIDDHENPTSRALTVSFVSGTQSESCSHHIIIPSISNQGPWGDLSDYESQMLCWLALWYSWSGLVCCEICKGFTQVDWAMGEDSYFCISTANWYFGSADVGADFEQGEHSNNLWTQKNWHYVNRPLATLTQGIAWILWLAFKFLPHQLMYHLDWQQDMRRWVQLVRLISLQLGSPHHGRVPLKKNWTLFLLLWVVDFAAISDTLHMLNVY